MPKSKRKKKYTKNYAFIDSQNLNLAIKNLGWRLNFRKFRNLLKTQYKVEKAFLFIGYIPGHESLYDSLEKAGYIIVFKPTVRNRNGEIKGNVDAELVLHTMIEFSNFDGAIIVSGDGDFHCLVEYLLKQRKLFKVGIPNRKRFSSLLKKYRHYFFFVSDLEEKLRQNKRRR